MPGLSRLAVSPQISQTLEEAGRHPLHPPASQQAAAPLALVGYNEPSAVFLLGTATRLASAAGAARALRAGEVSAAIVERRHLDAFHDRLGQDREAVSALAVIDGLNYSNGDTVSLTIYVRGAVVETQADR